MDKSNSNTIRYRIEQLEKNYNQLDTKLDHLLTNELPHIQEELTALKTRIAVSTVINVGAFILVGLLMVFLKA